MAIKKRNPRYLVSLDGYDLATVPAFTKIEAVKRAKQIYPGRRGTWTAVQVEDEMFGRMRGGAETEARMRLERKRAAAAARATGNTKRPRRNGTHIHAETVGHLDVSKVHNPDASRNKAAYYTLLNIYGGKANIPTLSYFLRDVKTADQDYRRIMGGASPPTLRALNMDPGPGSTTDDTLSMVKARYHDIENTLGHYSALSDMHYVSQMLISDAHMAESRFSDVMEENPTRPVSRYEYTLGTWWQPYIEYGDDSDVSIEEIQQWDAFRKRLPPGGHWSFTEDTYFGKDEITGKRGDVSDAYYVIAR